MIRPVSPRLRQFAKEQRSNQSKLEAALWRELRAKRLDGWKFKRQVPIEGYIVDFVCFEARLIVEVDGPLHDKLEQLLDDAERDAVLRAEGFRVLGFGRDAILGDLAGVVRRIRQALEAGPLPAFG